MDKEQLDNPTKGTEQETPTPTPAATPAPEPVKTGESGEVVDVATLSEADFDKHMAALEGEEIAGQQKPAEGKKTDIPPVAGQEPEKKPEGGDHEDKGEGKDGLDEVAQLRARLETLEKERNDLTPKAKLIDEFQQNPDKFLKDHPEVKERITQTSAPAAPGQMPAWVNMDPDHLSLPQHPSFGPYAGWPLSAVKEQNPEAYQELRGWIAGQQAEMRGEFRARQSMLQESSQQRANERFGAAVKSFGDSLRQTNPQITDQEVTSQTQELTTWMVDYVNRNGGLTLVDAARLRDFDKVLAEAKESGRREGREAVLTELKRVDAAPGSASQRGAAAASEDEVARYNAMSKAEQSEFIMSLDDKGYDAFMAKLEREAA